RVHGPPSPTLFPYTTLFRSEARPGRRRRPLVENPVENGEHTAMYADDAHSAGWVPRALLKALLRVAIAKEEAALEANAAKCKVLDRKSTRLNSSHQIISYAV